MRVSPRSTDHGRQTTVNTLEGAGFRSATATCLKRINFDIRQTTVDRGPWTVSQKRVPITQIFDVSLKIALKPVSPFFVKDILL